MSAATGRRVECSVEQVYCGTVQHKTGLFFSKWEASRGTNLSRALSLPAVASTRPRSTPLSFVVHCDSVLTLTPPPPPHLARARALSLSLSPSLIDEGLPPPPPHSNPHQHTHTHTNHHRRYQ
jgi:hypothetical protein